MINKGNTSVFLKMKKILYVFAIFTAFCIASCRTTKTLDNNISVDSAYGVSAQAAQTFLPETLSFRGVDSLLKADRLPDLKKWSAAYYKDDETNERNEYRTLYDRTSWTIYTVKKVSPGKWVLVKRIIKTSK